MLYKVCEKCSSFVTHVLDSNLSQLRRRPLFELRTGIALVPRLPWKFSEFLEYIIDSILLYTKIHFYFYL